MRALMSIAAVLAMLYLGLCGTLFVAQRSLLYFPQPRTHSGPETAQMLAVGDAQIQLSVLPRPGPKALLYFGGNAEDVSASLEPFARAFPDHALYLMHYRGYGGSSGTPSEDALHADAQALFAKVHAEHPRITVIGRSLGSGVATRLAGTRPVERLVLVTPFDSLTAVAAHHYPYVPVSLLLKDRFDSAQIAPKITAPTSILAAERDQVIPASHAERLHARFPPGVATLTVLPGADHNDISSRGDYLDLLAGDLGLKSR